jgi:hypothetical protein
LTAGFRFNVEGAILGVLEPLDDDHPLVDKQLPHLTFLATRLLPCGPVDQPIQKFTGNNDCGAAPTDPITLVLHAFSHFIAVYTGNDAILCDLQGTASQFCGHILTFLPGMYDRKRVMVLIDPQMHTYVFLRLSLRCFTGLLILCRAEKNKDRRMYWDNGPVAIQRFMEHHLRVCSENGVCNRLDLRNLTYELPSDNDRPQTPPPSTRVVRARSASKSPSQRKKAKGSGGPYRAGTSTLFTVAASSD